MGKTICGLKQKKTQTNMPGASTSFVKDVNSFFS